MSGGRDRPRPPRWLSALLARLIPDGAAGPSSVLGDLCEEFEELHARRGGMVADAWYALQVLTLGVPWAAAAARANVAEGLHGVGLDLRSTLRGLRRQPALVGVAVLSLSLGSGLVTAAATFVNGAWYAPLPWAASDRMVVLSDTHPAEIPEGMTPGTSVRAFERWRTDLPPGLFERLEAGMPDWVPVRVGNGGASTLRAVRISGGYADLLELQPLIGRLPDPTDTGAGAEPVVALSHGLWRGAFGEDPEAIGRVVEIDGVAHTVIGVLDPAARPLEEAEVLIPLRPAGPDATFDRRGVQVIGVLAEGVTAGAAGVAVSSLASGMYAEADELSPEWSAAVTALRTVLARRGVPRTGALALAVICLVVLLVATLNLASLLLSRTSTRTREFGVRAALGAGNVRVARAGAMDGLVLAAAGGALGLVVVVVARDLALGRFAAEIPGWASFPIDVRVLVASIGGTALTAVLVGLLPVMHATAIGRQSGIAHSAVGQSGRSSSRARNILLGGQVVLALTLVAASAGALRTFAHASDFDRLGYRWQGLTGVVVSPEWGEGGNEVADAAALLHTAAGGYAPVTAHTTSRFLGLVGREREEQGTIVRVGGGSEALAAPATPRRSLAVGPAYFELNEIPILSGRAISAADGPGAPPAVVVSADAARAMWPGRVPESILGETVELERNGSGTVYTVVGVAGPVILDPAADGDRPTPRLYPSILQTPDALYGEEAGLQLRVSTGGVPPTMREWTAWIGGVLPGAGVSRLFDVEDDLSQRVRPVMLIGSVLAGLGALVLALVAVGVYGAVSYRIASSRREIGIRLVLGADAGQVVRAVVGSVARVVLVALAVGVPLALGAERVLSAGGMPVGAVDPGTLVLVVMLMIGATAAASWGPLRRALTIDPSVSLREE